MIHDRLKEIYDEFDRHCRSSNIDYSIDADYYNVQAYRLVGHNDISGVLRHMANYIKDKDVNLDYDGFKVDYNDLKSKNFNVSTYNPLFKFTLKPLQEESMSLQEDSLKQPSNAHARKQAAFPTSFRKLKTRDTYEGEKSPKKKKKEKVDEAFGSNNSFADRLSQSISENVGLSMVPPDILLTRNPADKEEDETEEEVLNDIVQTESRIIERCLSLLNEADEEKSLALESIIERCTRQVNEVKRLLEDQDGIN